MNDIKELESRIKKGLVSIKEIHDVNNSFYQIYRSLWNPRDSGQEDRVKNWTKSKELYNQVAHQIWLKFKELHSSNISYAYSPRESTSSNGASHIVLNKAYDLGRRKREDGDALCKKRKSFWMLSPVSDSEPNCLKCLQIAEDLLKKANLTK